MAERMKALVKAKAEPGIWMDEVPVPEPGPTEVLIKIRKTAICGTDVHIYNWDDWSQATLVASHHPRAHDHRPRVRRRDHRRR
jgi:threonine 3-dehydrogenase